MTAIHLQPCRDGPEALRRHAGLDALSDAAHWLRGTLRAWHRRVRERNQLARLDERMLTDLGLTRADAEFLINKPFWRE